MIAIVCRTRR